MPHDTIFSHPDRPQYGNTAYAAVRDPERIDTLIELEEVYVGPVVNVQPTDHGATIQAKLDNAAGLGRRVHFGAGLYEMSAYGTLYVSDGANISGDGSKLVVVHNTDSAGFAKKAAATVVYDVRMSGLSVRADNTGTDSTVGFDFTAFARGQFSDLVSQYKRTGFLYRVNAGGGACYYNKSRRLIAWDTKIGFDFDTTLSVNANKFSDTEVMRTAGTWDAGGGEVGIRVSGVGNHFSRTYISAAGANSRALQFLPSPAANSHNIFANGLYIESQPTTDIDATDTASPNFVDDFLCDGRPSPIILDNNLNLTYRTAAASVTLNGVAGKPAHQWARSILANGSGLGTRIGYTAFYPPSSGADPTVPTPLPGALHYRTDLNKLRIYNGTAWETVTSA